MGWKLTAGVDDAQQHVVAWRRDDRQRTARRSVVGTAVDESVVRREHRHVERVGIRVECRVDVREEHERLLVVTRGGRAVGLACLRRRSHDERAVEALRHLLADVLVERRDARCRAGLVDRGAHARDEGVRRVSTGCDLGGRRSHRLLRHGECERLAQVVVQQDADGVAVERVEDGPTDLRDRRHTAVVGEGLDRHVGHAWQVDRARARPQLARDGMCTCARADRRPVGVRHRGRVARVVDRGHSEGVCSRAGVERLAAGHRSRARGHPRSAGVGAVVRGADGLTAREYRALRGCRQCDRGWSRVDGVGVRHGARGAVGVGGGDGERLGAGRRRIDRGAVRHGPLALGDRGERARVGSAGEIGVHGRRRCVDGAVGRRRERDGWRGRGGRRCDQQRGERKERAEGRMHADASHAQSKWLMGSMRQRVSIPPMAAP